MSNIKEQIRSLPRPVIEAAAAIGRDISAARRLRQQTQLEFASRLGVDVRTLAKLERGDPSVSYATYLTAMWALGQLNRVRDLSALSNDQVGIARVIEDLPRRVRRGPRR